MVAWEEELGREYATLLSNVLLHVEVWDQWVWKLHSSHRYIAKSVYSNLIVAGVDFNLGFNHVLWITAIPLKVNIFIWRLFLNQIYMKDNLFRRNILPNNDIFCSVACGCAEDKDHVFLQCDVYGRLWNLIYDWLGFYSVPNENLLDHILQFGGLGSFSKKSRLTFNII